jgi:hypothetical protein
MIQDISRRQSDLASRIASGKTSASSPEVYELKRDVINHANALQAMEAEAKKINEAQKVFSTNQDYNRENYLGHPLLDYNTKYIQSGAKGPYIAPGMAQYTDRQNEIDKYAKGVGEENFKSILSTTAKPGYIYGYNSRGVSKDKIASEFENAYKYGVLGKADALEIAHEAASKKIDPNSYYATVRIPVGKDKKGKIMYEDKDLTFSEYKSNELFHRALDIAKTRAKEHIDQKLSGDPVYAANKREEEAKKITLPGTTEGYDSSFIPMFDNIPGAKAYISTDANGARAIQWDKLTKDLNNGSNSITGSIAKSINNLLKLATGVDTPMLAIAGNKDISKANAQQFSSALKQGMEKAAILTGFQGKVAPENYNAIMQEADNLRRARSLALDLKTDESDFAGADIKQHADKYKFYDESLNPISFNANLDFKALTRDFVPIGDTKGRRGVYKVAVYEKDKDGNITSTKTVYARPPKIEEQKSYDYIGNVNQSGMDWLMNGGGNSVTQAKDNYFHNKEELMKFDAAHTASWNKSGRNLNEKPVIVSTNKDPNDPSRLTVVYADPRDHKTQYVQEYRNENGRFRPLATDLGGEKLSIMPMGLWMQVKNEEYRASRFGRGQAKYPTYKDETSFPDNSGIEIGGELPSVE